MHRHEREFADLQQNSTNYVNYPHQHRNGAMERIFAGRLTAKSYTIYSEASAAGAVTRSGVASVQ